MSITSPVVQIAGFTKYTLGDEINSGYFGRVYVGVEVETGKEWACKVMEREKFSEKHRQNILDEVNFLFFSQFDLYICIFLFKKNYF